MVAIKHTPLARAFGGRAELTKNLVLDIFLVDLTDWLLETLQ